jgi:hypothetical protein
VPIVQRNFSLVVLGIIVVSVLPVAFEFLQAWQRRRARGGRAPVAVDADGRTP